MGDGVLALVVLPNQNPEKNESFPKANTKTVKVPEILVLDDAGAAFRHQSQQQHWHLPEVGKGTRIKPSLPQWIVLKLGGSVDKGSLWQRLQEIGAQKRLVIVVSVDVLRLMEAQLNPGLLWEQSAGQLMAELASKPALQPLRQCRHLVVSFGNDGAVWPIWKSRKPQPLS